MAYEPKARINHQIRASELRVVGETGENFGVMKFQDALNKAAELGLDLIEISPTANPPVAKIMDYGKYQYAENKKVKAAKAKSHVTEVKSIQIKIGTGEHDLELKAKQASEWLKEGHRVRINLFLSGRAKYMEMKFFQERIDRVLRLVSEEYKISDTAKKGPKGVSLMIEKNKTNMKTNKSYTKRLKVSKNGKITGRKPGQNHFNAKESRRSQYNKRRASHVHMSKGAIARFLP